MNCPYCHHPVMNHPDEEHVYCEDCWNSKIGGEDDLHCTHKRYNLERDAWKAEAMAARALIDAIEESQSWQFWHTPEIADVNAEYQSARVPEETEQPR